MRISRISTIGVVTQFDIEGTINSGPLDIAAGPDGNLWFTEQLGNRIGRITPLQPGSRPGRRRAVRSSD